MERGTFDDCFGYLAKFHKTDPSATAREAWWMAFKGEHDEVFCKAMMLHNDKQRPGLFPTLERFRGYLTDAREKAWEQKKRAEPKRPLMEYKPRIGDKRDKARAAADMALMLRAATEGYNDEIIAELKARWPAEDWESVRATVAARRRPKDGAQEKPEPRLAQVPRVERHFANVHERSAFYAELFARDLRGGV